MRIYSLMLGLCCGLIVACSSTGPDFPREETLVQELMPLQGITNPWKETALPDFSECKAS